jgi:hypothetical protein
MHSSPFWLSSSALDFVGVFGSLVGELAASAGPSFALGLVENSMLFMRSWHESEAFALSPELIDSGVVSVILGMSESH